MNMHLNETEKKKIMGIIYQLGGETSKDMNFFKEVSYFMKNQPLPNKAAQLLF